MERITKVFFNPLATTKAQIRDTLEKLSVGSAHPFSPDKVLLYRTATGIEEIDISSYPEEYFFNAIDLSELGETLQRRMTGFQFHIGLFKDYIVQQAPASTFKVPIVPDEIALLAVSELTPTYFDFCMGDKLANTCCWSARNTFPGIQHSGDILNGRDLLDYIKINKNMSTENDIAIVISGYQYTKLTRFQGSNPVVLVANHAEKVLYIVPVPLDGATIGEATLCCPLVIRRDGDSLVCSILPTPTTDNGKMISGAKLPSPLFAEAIRRADFDIPILALNTLSKEKETDVRSFASTPESISPASTKASAVLASGSIALPLICNRDSVQIIRFGTGIKFMSPSQELSKENDTSSVVLPCVFGCRLEGPILLATGNVPSNVPFSDEYALRTYYEHLASVVVVVDDRMTDNARNLAGPYRMNALFIIQPSSEIVLKDGQDVRPLLNSLNVNAVTSLAGPQSLVLVHISAKYYFYRGIANRKHLNTANLPFGSDVTNVINSCGIESMLDPRVKRLVKLGQENTVLLPVSGRVVQPQDLIKIFEQLSIGEIQDLKDDVSAAVPQLQALLDQLEIAKLSQDLTTVLSTKVNDVTATKRNAYIEFLTKEYKVTDSSLTKKKASMLGELRKTTLEVQKQLESVISALANMMSSQTTSKRTHDLKRLLRQTAIKTNVTASKTMTFDTVAAYLETYAADMGVMLLNIETSGYRQLLGNLKNPTMDASLCCDLDSRVLHLEGFDAGIIIPQSQSEHTGPLQSQLGPTNPILALPYLSQDRGRGSMLAWVCWDEFVNLKSPFSVRWIEKCNEAHIAALRIIMRATLSKAVASREHNMDPASPETGQLMSALLMAAMSKLAMVRTTPPRVTENAEDTVTKLMRGLFGNLLTIAGSGVRPLSMCWQLFGTESHRDVPSTTLEWSWYEQVVALYPYTGWPLQQFQDNLKGLLNKLLIRVAVKNEKNNEIKKSRGAELARFYQLRNIQLEKSRTIVTIFMKMLTDKQINQQQVATRLLSYLPHKLEKQSGSYGKMIGYLKHLASGGERRPQQDLITASVYTKRSAAFSELKNRIANACQENNPVQIKDLCQEIMNKHAEVASLWQVQVEVLKVQNMDVYQALLNADFGDDVDEPTKNHHKALIGKAKSDAERKRIPWQLGSEGKTDVNIESLDEAFLYDMLKGGTTPNAVANLSSQGTITPEAVAEKDINGFTQFSDTLDPWFISEMEKTLSPDNACRLIGLPGTTMRVFIKALNPEFVWEDLGENFKKTMMALIRERSGREGSHPINQLLDLEFRSPVILGIEA